MIHPSVAALGTTPLIEAFRRAKLDSLEVVALARDSRWQFYETIKESPENVAALNDEIRDVFRDGFGMPGWSRAGVSKTINRCSDVALLRSAQGRAEGYAFYVAHEDKAGTLLWEDAICLRKSAQGLGYSTQILDQLRLRHGNARWIGGRTQNPRVISRYATFGPVYPFDKSWESESGKSVMELLRRQVSEVGEVADLDIRTGICRGVYRERTLGDYEWQAHGRYESLLVEWGFERERGDAIVVLAEDVNYRAPVPRQ